MDILSRLPIKHQIICKGLSDPHFAKMHLLLKTLELRGSSRKIWTVDLQNPDSSGNLDVKFELAPKINLPNVSLKLVNSCNGLLCLHLQRKNLMRDEVYVRNPILGEYLILPELYNFYPDIKFGFGFCVETNEYKVLRVFNQWSSDAFFKVFTANPSKDCVTSRADVYTLGTKDWREIRVVPSYTFHRESFNTFLNGALHWIIGHKDTNPDFIYGFDFKTEQFNVVPPPAQFGPDQKKKNLDNISIGVLKGCLYMCLADTYVLDMWVMKEYGVKESWINAFTIVDLERSKFPQDNFQPILVKKNGEILMLYNNNVLDCYDPVLAKFTEVQICGIKSKFEAVAYIPSFISLKDIDTERKGLRVKVIKSRS